MAVEIDLPGGQIAEFPDDMPQSEIESVLQNHFGTSEPQQEKPLSFVPPQIPKSSEEISMSNIQAQKEMSAIPLQLPEYREPGYEYVTPEEQAQINLEQQQRESAPSVGVSRLSPWQQFRLSSTGQKLLGPTEAERAGMIGTRPGLLEIPQAMFQMTLPPPQIAKPVEQIAEHLSRTGGPIGGVAAGATRAAMGFASPAIPLVPFASLPRTARAAVAASVTGPYVAEFPGMVDAYKKAVNEGDYNKAAQIVTEAGLGGTVALLAPLGILPKTKPVIERTQNAIPQREATQVHVGETPGNRPEMGAQVREQAPAAEAPQVTQDQVALDATARTKRILEAKTPEEFTALGEPTAEQIALGKSANTVAEVEAFKTEAEKLSTDAKAKIREASYAKPEDATRLRNEATLLKSKANRLNEAYETATEGKYARTREPEYQPKFKVNEQGKLERRLNPEVEASLKEFKDTFGDKEIDVVDITDPNHEHFGEPFWMDSRGRIQVNSNGIESWMQRLGPEGVKSLKAYADTGLIHEGIHVKGVKAAIEQGMTPDQFHADYYNNASAVERAAANRSYYGKWGKQGSEATLGAEMLRRNVERLKGLDVTEVAQNRHNYKEWLTQKFLDYVERGVNGMRKAIGTKASAKQRSMAESVLNQYQQKIDAAREAMGYTSEALRMEPKAEESDAIKRAREIAGMDNSEFSKIAGFTGEAELKVGDKIKSRAELEELVKLSVEAKKQAAALEPARRKAIASKDMNAYADITDEINRINGKQQYFNEAVQWAYGEPGKVKFYKETKPDYKPSVPMTPEEVVAIYKKYSEPVSESLRMAPAKESIPKPINEITDKANRIRLALGTMIKAAPNRRFMDQRFDAADNMANNAGQQARNSLDIGTTPIQRQAAMAIVETGGDKSKLAEFARQAQKNPEALAAVRYANTNWDKLQNLANRTKALLDKQIADENAAGISTEYHEDYVPHVYDTDLWMGQGRPYVLSGKGSGTGSGFKKGRTFATVFDAIEEGYKPKTMDVGKLVEHRVKLGQKLMNRKAWAESLKTINDPTDNMPIAADLQTKTRPNGTSYQVAPTGYVPAEIIPGVRIAVREGYDMLFDALTGRSRISGSAPGRIALGVAGGIKHGLLLFDTFHASRIMQRQLFLTGKISYGKGHSLLEYADADLSRAVQNNLITPEIADWIKANRENANALIKEGLNVGRVQEALYSSFVKDMQATAAQKAKAAGIPEAISNKLEFSKWVFEKVTRGAMLESGIIELQRVMKARPELSREQAARIVARDLNVYFGNLGRQGFFKSRIMQDFANLFMLAPQWVESMARMEIKGAYQMAKGVTLDPALHRTILLGTLGKGMAQGLLAYFIGTQLLNQFTRGHNTFENPEPEHKFDVWIPDVSGESKGFFMSPLAVQAELMHDMLRYSENSPGKLAALGRIVQNKISPIARAAQVMITGKDWNKNFVQDDWDRIKRAAISLAPTPLPLSPLTRESAPGSLQRQLTASAGFKTEPAKERKPTPIRKAKRTAKRPR